MRSQLSHVLLLRGNARKRQWILLVIKIVWMILIMKEKTKMTEKMKQKGYKGKNL